MVVRIINQLEIRQEILDFHSLKEFMSADEPRWDLPDLKLLLDRSRERVVPDCIDMKKVSMSRCCMAFKFTAKTYVE